MLKRFWIAITVVWVLAIIVLFNMGVDAASAAWALPYAVAIAIVPPVLLIVMYRTLVWVVTGR